jgi:hypothetical protein
MQWLDQARGDDPLTSCIAECERYWSSGSHEAPPFFQPRFTTAP